MPGETFDHLETVDYIATLASALVGAGEPVHMVEETVGDLQERYGLAVGAFVMPTATIMMGAAAAPAAVIHRQSPSSLRFDQITGVVALVETSLREGISPRQGMRELDRVLALPPRFSPLAQLLAYVAMTVALVLMLAPTPTTIAVSSLCGLLVGVLKLGSARSRTLAAIVPAVASFGVGILVFWLARRGLDVDPLAAVIAPLVVLLPGGSLTIGTIELTQGSMLAGSSRLMAGFVQLLLLALGLVVALSVVRLSPADLDASFGTGWTSWVGVALFGAGCAVFFSAPRRSLRHMLIVLYVAWIAQVATSPILGGYMSGFVGALASVIAAALVQQMGSRLPAITLFLPAFWLMVPGAFGLIQLTRVASGSAGGGQVVAVLFTVLAIALGVVVGVAMASPLFGLTMFVRHPGRLRAAEPWRSAGADVQERIVVWTMWLSLAGLVLATLYLVGGR